MGSLEEIVKRMEAPIAFASADDYNRLTHVKNLETVMTALLRRMKMGLTGEEYRSRKDDIDSLSDLLLQLFNGYDELPPERKRDRLARATPIISELRSTVNELAGAEQPIRHGDEEDSNDRSILSRPVQFVQGIGPRIAARLARKNLSTIEDLLYFIPRRYEDRRNVSRIAETAHGGRQTVVGRIKQCDSRFYGRKKTFVALVDDGSGIMKVKWFNVREAILRSALKPETLVILTGEVTRSPFDVEMIHPDFEVLNDRDDQLIHFKRIVPIYSETEGLHQKTLRRIQWKVVRDYAQLIRSPIPHEICRKRGLMAIREGIHQVHFPANDQVVELYQESRSDAHRRLIYDEIFFFQLGMALRKRGEGFEQGISFRIRGGLLERFYGMLPFSLTAAQQRVISEIEKDMASNRCMGRLLQGDVGSGKTVVAMAGMVTACENGYQSAIMAPTEILAEQHYRNLKVWADQLGLRIEILTGGMKAAEKKQLLLRLEDGEVNLIVGTHALIQEGVSFHRLGFVVIDEQHRFGVVQRAALRKKGANPDVLVMTATPIPRTLAMTVYADLDLSVIDQLPPEKTPVRTMLFSEAQRARVYGIIRREVEKGNQIFIVYPLVEKSEKLDLKDATRMAEHLRKVIFPDCQIGLMHGQMKSGEKDRIMTDFAGKKIQILVSTTVIEVGIDIPRASLMVIEHAERFGLSQLHQLRGRVGRSGIPSYCILLVQKTGSEDSRNRLRIMEQTNDGFRIAEEDLAIRGPGEFIGTRQSGLPDFRIANILRDSRILGEAKEDAFMLVENDPKLEGPQHQGLMDVLLQRWGSRLESAKTG